MSLDLIRLGATSWRRPGGGSGACDPHFASVVSLLHFDGANGSTVITDVTGRAWTAQSGAQIVTSPSIADGSSGEIQVNLSRFETAGTADFNWSLQPYTIECMAQLSAYGGDIYGRPRMIGHSSNEPGVYNWGMGPNASGNFSFFYWAGQRVNFVSTIVIPLGVPVHLAMTYDMVDLRLFVNGVLGGTFPISLSMQALSAPFLIGISSSTSSEKALFHVDEFRVTKGVARYLAAFTPPTGRFPDIGC